MQDFPGKMPGYYFNPFHFTANVYLFAVREMRVLI